jgi:hypothetical protein
MRFYEFVSPARPVLKISQQQKAKQKELDSNTPPTPWPTNKPPTPGPETVKVYPKQWQRQWLQKYLAAQMARNAQTIKPTEMDIVRAQMIYADAQRQADRNYEKSLGNADQEEGRQNERRWVKRD